MLTSVVGRLIWKEYRVQRGLWALLLGLLLALQIILRVAFFTNSTSQSSYNTSTDELWATWAMWFVAFAAHVGFLVASIAIAFAGEREEQTSAQLVQLSPSPWAVLLAKVGTCLVGSLVIYLCGAVLALLLGRSTPNDPYASYQLFFINHAIGMDLATRAAIMFGLLVWCMFGSLLSQRVLTSIPTMAAGWVVTGWIPMTIVIGFVSLLPNDVGARSDRTIVMIGFLLVAVGMVAVDLWLGYRWVEGKYCDFQQLSRYSEFWSRLWHDFVDRSARPSRIPRGGELEDNERRPWQRLVWQERQRSGIARWFAIVVSFFVLAAGPALDASQGSFGVPSVHDTVVCLLALAMGVLSYRSEGEGHPVRFLANHGTSAETIWKAKQAVWLTRAFVIPAVLLVLVALRDSKLSTYPVSLIERHIWLIVLSYGCGQLSAMLLKRAMLAAITGAAAAGVLFLWFELMRSLKMPLWWSLGIPAVTPLLATRLHARSWLLDGSTRSQKIRLSAVLIGLPLVAFAVVAIYRVKEIQRTAPTWRSGPIFQTYHTWQYQHELGNLPVPGAPVVPPNRLQKGESPDVWASKGLVTRARLLAIADTPLERRPLTTLISGPLILTSQERQLAAEVAGYFTASAPLIHLAVDQPKHLFPVSSFSKLSDLLLLRARADLQANEPQAAYDVCLAHLNLCQTMARGPFMPCWRAAAEQERRSLELLVEWANHRQVGFAQIHGAIRELEELLGQFPSPSAAIVDELTEARHRSIVEAYAERYSESTVGWRRIWLQLPWEVSRRQQLWEIEGLIHRVNLSHLANQISHGPDLAARITYGPNYGGDFSVPVGGDYLKPVAGLQATTWGAEVALANDRSEFVRDRFTATKAAVTRMGIIAYRKQYGKMPADLDAVIGIVRQANFQDPWSSGRFDYRTGGLTSQGTSQKGIDLESRAKEGAAGRPLEASRFVFPIPLASTEPVTEPPAPEGNKTR